MADIVITTTAVTSGTNAAVDSGIAGEAIVAGKAIYLDPTTNRLLLSDNNATGKRVVNGVALNGASAGQPVDYQKSGDITIGATLVAGQDYWLSGTPGGIAPRADIVTGMDPILVGIAKTTAVLTLSVVDVGVTI